MGIESGTKISDLNPAWPLGSDPKSEGDNHIRLIKAILQADAAPLSTGGRFQGDVKVAASAITDPVLNNNPGAMIGTSGQVSASMVNGTALRLNRGNDGGIAGFYRAGVFVGSISVTATATAYNTTSDYRLKDQVVPLDPETALARVLRARPCRWVWRATGLPGHGFVAHELAETHPDAVAGEKDAVGPDGLPAYQGVDASRLVDDLVASIHALEARIRQLEARG